MRIWINRERERCKYSVVDLTPDEMEYDAIPTIDDGMCDTYEGRVKNNLATVEEVLAIKKYKMRNFLNAEDVDGEKAAELWKWLNEKNKWEQFWNIVNERHVHIHDVVLKEVTSRYANVSSRKSTRRAVMDKIVKLMGFTSSTQTGGIIKVENHMEGLGALYPEFMRAFGSCSNGRKEEGSAFDQRDAIHMVETAWRVWCGIKLMSEETQKTVGGKRKRFFTLTIPEFPAWDMIRGPAVHEEHPA